MMTVSDLAWICIGITVNTVTFFVGMVVGASATKKPRDISPSRN